MHLTCRKIIYIFSTQQIRGLFYFMCHIYTTGVQIRPFLLQLFWKENYWKGYYLLFIVLPVIKNLPQRP